jgi:hypothetical protein
MIEQKVSAPPAKADMPLNSHSSADSADRRTLPRSVASASSSALAAASSLAIANPRVALTSSDFVALALSIEQFVERVANDRDHRAAFLGQRANNQRLVGDGEAAECRAGALLALVAASLGGKPCLLLGMPTSPFGERITTGGSDVTRMLLSSGRRADRC